MEETLKEIQDKRFLMSYDKACSILRAFLKTYTPATDILKGLYKITDFLLIHTLLFEQKRWRKWKKMVWCMNEFLERRKKFAKEVIPTTPVAWSAFKQQFEYRLARKWHEFKGLVDAETWEEVEKRRNEDSG